MEMFYLQGLLDEGKCATQAVGFCAFVLRQNIWLCLKKSRNICQLGRKWCQVFE